MISGSKEVFCVMVSASSRLFAMLPRMSGTTIKKEKRAAFSLSIPNKTATAIVEPLLEIPGKMATACVRPMTNALNVLMSFRVDFALSARLIKRRSIEAWRQQVKYFDGKAA